MHALHTLCTRSMHVLFTPYTRTRHAVYALYTRPVHALYKPHTRAIPAPFSGNADSFILDRPVVAALSNGKVYPPLEGRYVNIILSGL